MENTKLMRWMGTVVFLTTAIFNAITIFTIADDYPFGPEIAGPYSIFSSYKFFLAYHIWGIIVAVVCTYAMWKEAKMLFWISLFLLMILMFYPYFTSSPVDRAQGKAQAEEAKRREDSLSGKTAPVQVDSLRQDSGK